jgi:hypothetical protein
MPYVPVQPVLDMSVRGLCSRPYPGHPHGCPNFMRAERCPPKAPTLPDVFDMSSPFFAVYSRFPLGEHVRMMTLKHPDWSPRQISCVLYWQGSARKNLRHEITRFRVIHPLLDWLIETTPEAYGVNVTETMRAAGVELPWPPREFAYHVALAGVRAGKQEKRVFLSDGSSVPITIGD